MRIKTYSVNDYRINVEYDDTFDATEELKEWGGDDIFITAYSPHLWVERNGFSKDEVDEMIEDGNTEYTFLPLYAYIHGGITLSLKPFSCKWDSGQVGWVIRKVGVDWCADESKAERLVDLWDKACLGEVYRCTVYHKEEVEDDIGGFIGMDSVEAFISEYSNGNRE